MVGGIIKIANGYITEFTELAFAGTACRAINQSERRMDHSGTSVFYVQKNSQRISQLPSRQTTIVNQRSFPL
jgi:hypothetical protein